MKRIALVAVLLLPGCFNPERAYWETREQVRQLALYARQELSHAQADLSASPNQHVDNAAGAVTPVQTYLGEPAEPPPVDRREKWLSKTRGRLDANTREMHRRGISPEGMVGITTTQRAVPGVPAPSLPAKIDSGIDWFTGLLWKIGFAVLGAVVLWIVLRIFVGQEAAEAYAGFFKIVFLVIASIMSLGVVALVWAYMRIKTYRAAFEQTVVGVDKAQQKLTPKAKSTLYTELEKAHDAVQKRLVASVKSQIRRAKPKSKK